MHETIEQKITNILQNTVMNLGFELVKVSFSGPDSSTLEILIDRLEVGRVSITDCQVVSKNLAPLLDVEDLIKHRYYLAVSSAGIERPLIKLADYQRFLGSEIKTKLKKILNGCSHYQGKITKIEGENIYLKVKNQILAIPFDLIKTAHLVFTDEMFKKSLNPHSV